MNQISKKHIVSFFIHNKMVWIAIYMNIGQGQKIGKLTSGEITIRVILLVHAFWRTLSTMTVLVPIIVFLAWVLLGWAWKTTTGQDVNNLFARLSKVFFLSDLWEITPQLLRFLSHALAFHILLTILIQTYINTQPTPNTFHKNQC